MAGRVSRTVSGFPYDFEAFRDRLSIGGLKPRSVLWPDPQLLGHARNEQGEAPVSAGPWVHADTDERDWCVLLHLPLMDWGSFSILIRREDLAEGRYERLATDISLD